jgi:hypothetical protein
MGDIKKGVEFDLTELEDLETADKGTSVNSSSSSLRGQEWPSSASGLRKVEGVSSIKSGWVKKGVLPIRAGLGEAIGMD